MPPLLTQFIANLNFILWLSKTGKIISSLAAGLFEEILFLMQFRFSLSFTFKIFLFIFLHLSIISIFHKNSIEVKVHSCNICLHFVVDVCYISNQFIDNSISNYRLIILAENLCENITKLYFTWYIRFTQVNLWLPLERAENTR